MGLKLFILIILLLTIFFLPVVVSAQGLSSTDIYNAFKYRMHPDPIFFDDATIYQLINMASEIASVDGFAYPKIDTLVLATNTTDYGLKKLAIWVYKVGKISEGERSWQNIALEDFGKEGLSEVSYPAYWDFVTIMEGVSTVFNASKDTSYIYIYPKPTASDNGDSIAVHYFAFADTISGNLRSDYREAVLDLALMLGYLRKGRSDMAVMMWNEGATNISLLRNAWLNKLFNIEVVPKVIGEGK